MKILRTIQIKSEGKYHSLSFGISTTDEELEEIFHLRYEVYVLETKYGNKSFFPEEKEYDEYDLKGECKYFLATLDKTIVGTARLVMTSPLPVEKDYFEFQEPPTTKKIPRNKLVEVSRLISRPSKFAFPRHLIIFGLFDSMLQFSHDNDIRAGYAAIDQSLKEKLEKLRFPFYLIKNFRIKKSSLTEKFPGYFSLLNKLYLIYFFEEEVNRYIRKVMGNKYFFKRVDENTLIFQNRLYYKFIKWFSKIFSL